DVAVETLPLLSVTVKVTLFVPTLVQLKEFGDTAIDAMPQASELLLSTSDAAMVALPDAFNCTVTFFAMAVGSVKSCTVTTDVAVETLPLLSVTVNVTELAPTLVQLNELGDTANVAIPQASVLLLSTSDAAMVALPDAFNCIVIFFAAAVGSVKSCTVTTDVAVETLPLLSVTVSVAVLLPTLVQLNEFGDTAIDTIPQASVLLLLTSTAAIVAAPAAFN
ncbi:MAG: hypothetical protein HW421_1963, partial [Ignavibacteria bacterium]|nr:hypothetical protein [Ignavibacteria bacterium]